MLFVLDIIQIERAPIRIGHGIGDPAESAADIGQIEIGKINREGLKMDNYQAWYNYFYDEYEVDWASMDQLFGYLDGLQVRVFLGTWCSDSQMQVPQFLKMMDYLGFPETSIQMYALSDDPDNYLTSPEGVEKGFNVEFVPTFIFYRNGLEIGRISEYPGETLEKEYGP